MQFTPPQNVDEEGPGRVLMAVRTEPGCNSGDAVAQIDAGGQVHLIVPIRSERGDCPGRPNDSDDWWHDLLEAEPQLLLDGDRLVVRTDAGQIDMVEDTSETGVLPEPPEGSFSPLSSISPSRVELGDSEVALTITADDQPLEFGTYFRVDRWDGETWQLQHYVQGGQVHPPDIGGFLDNAYGVEPGETLTETVPLEGLGAGVHRVGLQMWVVGGPSRDENRFDVYARLDVNQPESPTVEPTESTNPATSTPSTAPPHDADPAGEENDGVQGIVDVGSAAVAGVHLDAAAEALVTANPAFTVNADASLHAGSVERACVGGADIVLLATPVPDPACPASVPAFEVLPLGRAELRVWALTPTTPPCAALQDLAEEVVLVVGQPDPDAQTAGSFHPGQADIIATQVLHDLVAEGLILADTAVGDVEQADARFAVGLEAEVPATWQQVTLVEDPASCGSPDPSAIDTTVPLSALVDIEEYIRRDEVRALVETMAAQVEEVTAAHGLIPPDSAQLSAALTALHAHR